MTRALAIDLGGTNIRAALHAAPPGGPEDTAAALLHEAAPQNLDAFVEIVRAVLDGVDADAIGIAIPGLVTGTVCRWAPNLPWLDGVDLAPLFPDQAVTAANDAHFSLLAEAAAGAAKGSDNAILLAIGTGIGSALLADGHIIRGTGGAAVSFGWACAQSDAAGDPQHGWLERQASGRALDRAARALGLGNGSDLVAAARRGDAKAIAALEHVGQVLGAALAGAVALTGTQKILIAGGVSSALDLIAPALTRTLKSHLPTHLHAFDLAAGAFGAQAAICGAALAAHQHPIWGER